MKKAHFFHRYVSTRDYLQIWFTKFSVTYGDIHTSHMKCIYKLFVHTVFRNKFKSLTDSLHRPETSFKNQIRF